MLIVKKFGGTSVGNTETTKTTASSAIIKPKKTARFPNTTDNMAGEEATYNDVRAVTTRARNIRPYTLRITIDKTDVPVVDL